MLTGNYDRHLKVLGKLARLWDDASADSAAQKLLISRMIDQVATGEVDSYPATLLLNAYTLTLNSAITAGAEAIRSTAVTMAAAYLISTDFTDDLTTAPSATTAQAVLEALQTEMAAGLDNKTLTDTASTGFVNFFDTNWSPSGAWNTEADGTADYKDSVYVVTTIV